MPFCVTLASLSDVVLMFAFNIKFHPWAPILQAEENGEVEKLVQEAELIILDDEHHESDEDLPEAADESTPFIRKDGEEKTEPQVLKCY